MLFLLSHIYNSGLTATGIQFIPRNSQFLMFWLTCDFLLTNDFNTAEPAYGKCREHSTWQDCQLPKRLYTQHFFQMDIVVKVQWTASR
jgi:hypothetical protein